MTIVFLKGCIVLYIVLYLSISIALLTAGAFQKRSRPQQLTLCRSLHAEALQAIAGKELAQGPYMTARAGFEPTTLRSHGVVSSNAPPCIECIQYLFMYICECEGIHTCIYIWLSPPNTVLYLNVVGGEQPSRGMPGGAMPSGVKAIG